MIRDKCKKLPERLSIKIMQAFEDTISTIVRATISKAKL